MKKKILIYGAAAAFVLCAIIVGIWLIANSAAGGTTEEKIAAAQQFEEEGKIKKAENTYKSAIRDNPEDAEASKKLANMYIEEGNYKKAEKVIDEILPTNREDAEIYDAKLKLYRENGNVGEAFAFVRSIGNDEMRQRCLDLLYDRTSESSLIMGNTSGNYANYGAMAFAGNAVFYSNPADANKLYKLENGENKLLVDSKTSYLSAVGDYIYYIDNNKSDAFYKMKTDGSENTRIGDVTGKSLMIIGGKMYFINSADSKIYSMEMDGKKLTKLSDTEVNEIFTYGDKIYGTDFENTENSVRISLDGKDEQEFFDTSAGFITGNDDMLYYRDNLNLGIRADSVSSFASWNLHESRSGFINTKGGYVYFVDFEDNGSIIKCKPDGSEKEKLTSDDAESLSIDGDYIYYFSRQDGRKLYRIKTDGSGRERLN